MMVSMVLRIEDRSEEEVVIERSGKSVLRSLREELAPSRAEQIERTHSRSVSRPVF